MGQLQIDRALLARSGAGIIAGHAAALGGYQAFRSQLDTQDQEKPWGPDNFGQTVDMCYSAAKHFACDSVQENLDALHDHGQRVQMHQQNSQDAEDANISNAKTLQA